MQKNNREKVGVAWVRKFTGKPDGFKISINKEIFFAYKNTKKTKDTDPDYIVVKYLDPPKQNKK